MLKNLAAECQYQAEFEKHMRGPENKRSMAKEVDVFSRPSSWQYEDPTIQALFERFVADFRSVGL